MAVKIGGGEELENYDEETGQYANGDIVKLEKGGIIQASF